MVKRLWESSGVRFIREMVDIYFSKHVPRSAAELAYFLILTLFPILICINAFIAVIHVNVDSILSALRPFLPPGMLAIVSEYLKYITVNDSPALLAAGLFMTLFSASAAMRSLMDVMDEIYGRKSFRGIWQILASVIFSVLLLITIYLSIVVVMTGNWFFHLLERHLPFHLPIFANWDWQWIRFLLLFGVVFCLVFVVYRMSAPLGKPRAPVVTGALVASVALVGASMLFSVFIGMSSRYSLVYGSLASVVILLLWLYICGNVLILGNVFNCVWYQRKKARGPKPSKEKKTKKVEKNP